MVKLSALLDEKRTKCLLGRLLCFITAPPPVTSTCSCTLEAHGIENIFKETAGSVFRKHYC